MSELYKQYKQTIMDILTCWKESPLFELDDKLCDCLSSVLHIDLYDLLKETKSVYELSHIGFDYSSIIQKAAIFNLYMKYGITKLNLEDVIVPDCIDIVGLFFPELQQSVSWLVTSNSDLMCIVSQELDLKNTLFDDPYLNPLYLVKSIQNWACISTDDNEAQISQFIGLMVRLSKYEITTQYEAIYLITILSMISSSAYFDESIRNLAQEVRDYLFFILKNGKILGLRINMLSPHTAGEYSTKNDNTTRFQLVYSFGNFDAYCLRFDLPHEGVEYTHINNISPGGIKSSLFSEEEFNKLVRNNKTLEKCFIKYGLQYAIIEKVRKVDGVKKTEIDQLISSKEHQSILKSNYSEDTINSFIEILSYCLPTKCNRKLDTNNEYATNVFHYNLAMRNVFAAVILFEAGEYKLIEKVLDSIGEMAYSWGTDRCASD